MRTVMLWNMFFCTISVCTAALSVRPSYLWLTTSTSSSSPTSSYELLSETAAFRTLMSTACDSFHFCHSFAAERKKRGGGAPDQHHCTGSSSFAASDERKLTQHAWKCKLAVKILLSLFWLVINYVAFPALHYLESGEERSHLTHS